MSFCREYCLLAVFGVRVRFWLFRGLAACFTVVCLFYAAVCALCAWFRWFTSFICHILSLSGGRRLCVCCVRRFLRFVRLFLTAVCVFQHFCVNWCFLCCFPTFVWFFNSCLFFFCCACFFCANFSSLLMSVFIFFSAVECCLLAICVFTFPHYKLDFLSAWRLVLW